MTRHPIDHATGNRGAANDRGDAHDWGTPGTRGAAHDPATAANGDPASGRAAGEGLWAEDISPADPPGAAAPRIVLRPFRPEDQTAAQALILAGLAEYWGTLDPAMNPDLDDIAATYADGLFLVAWQLAPHAVTRTSLGDQGPLSTAAGAADRPRASGERGNDAYPRLVGTGALLPRDATTAEVVRMSVASDLRRQGLGRRILDALIRHAAERGFRRLILETTATWQGAIAFYQDAGFRITHAQSGDLYFELRLPNETGETDGSTSNPTEEAS